MARINKKSVKTSHAKNSPRLPASPTFKAGVGNFIARYEIILLFVILFLAYNTISGVGFISGDVAPATYLPVSLIIWHNVFFDVSLPSFSNTDLAYAFPLVNGHYVSLFPVVTPVLATPVYAISWALHHLFNIPVSDADLLLMAKLLAKTSAAVFAALAGVLVYITAKEFFSKRVAILTTFIFAFATSTWAISSQALWQHGTVELLLIAMICLVVQNERKEWTGYILLLGVVSGLYVFTRPPDFILLLPILVYMAWYQRSKILYYGAGCLLSGLPFLWYNYSIFGNIFGGYAENLSLFSFSSDFIWQYIGLLVAPNVGLFIFCPVLVLSIAGFLKVYRSPESKIKTLLLLFFPAILLQILVYSFFNLWFSSAAYCFGPRFLTCLVPVLCLYTGFFLEDLLTIDTARQISLGKWIAGVAVGCLIVLSVGIQCIGVFLYGWSSEQNLTMNEDRAWNGSDSIIVNSYTTGLQQIPGVSMYILPPIPPLLKYSFQPDFTED